MPLGWPTKQNRTDLNRTRKRKRNRRKTLRVSGNNCINYACGNILWQRLLPNCHRAEALASFADTQLCGPTNGELALRQMRNCLCLCFWWQRRHLQFIFDGGWEISERDREKFVRAALQSDSQGIGTLESQNQNRSWNLLQHCLLLQVNTYNVSVAFSVCLSNNREKHSEGGWGEKC